MKALVHVSCGSLFLTSIAGLIRKGRSQRVSALSGVLIGLADTQVLGGAGPAIAAVPLTVVWAGGAFYTLASGLGAGKVGPRGAVQRVGYTFFMAIADVRTPSELMHTSRRCCPWYSRLSVTSVVGLLGAAAAHQIVILDQVGVNMGEPLQGFSSRCKGKVDG